VGGTLTFSRGEYDLVQSFWKVTAVMEAIQKEDKVLGVDRLISVSVQGVKKGSDRNVP
jgi:hypothetical protein